MRQPQILVVDDDHVLRDVPLRGQRDEGFDTAPARDGASAPRLASGTVDGVVRGAGLPDAAGRDVCRPLGANGSLSPVVFLTAHHGPTDRLTGFAADGDDRPPRPFHLVELAARPLAALRRTGPWRSATAGDTVLDAVRHSLTVRGTSVEPTPSEFRVLDTRWRRSRLARSAGGDVRYDEQHVPGARFTVSLPAGRAAEQGTRGRPSAPSDERLQCCRR